MLAIGSARRELPSSGRATVQVDVVDEGVTASGPWDAIVLTAFLQQSSCVAAELRTLDLALRLLQALRDPLPPVWLRTRGTQPVSLSRSPVHAGLWGLGRACRQERTTLPVWCVDVCNSGAHDLSWHDARAPALRLGAKPTAVSVALTPTLLPVGTLFAMTISHLPDADGRLVHRVPGLRALPRRRPVPAVP